MLIALQAIGVTGSPLLQVNPDSGNVRAVLTAGNRIGPWEVLEPQTLLPGGSTTLARNEFRTGRQIRFRANERYVGTPPGTARRVTARGQVGPFSLTKLAGSSSGVVVGNYDIVALVAGQLHAQVQSDGAIDMKTGDVNADPAGMFRAIVDIGIESVSIRDPASSNASISSLSFSNLGSTYGLLVHVKMKAPYAVPTDAVLYTPQYSGTYLNVPTVADAWGDGGVRSVPGPGQDLPPIPITVFKPTSRVQYVKVFAALWPEQLIYGEDIRSDANKQHPRRHHATLKLTRPLV